MLLLKKKQHEKPLLTKAMLSTQKIWHKFWLELWHMKIIRGCIRWHLGMGGTHISTAGEIIYLTPNTTGSDAALYNQTYYEQVDPASETTPTSNGVVSSQSSTPKTSSIITCTVELATSEPNGQYSTNSTNTSTDSTYSFDEIGLFSADGLMLTHIIFEPITKTANIWYIITYTVEVKVS
jgi:hypothetical protein